MSNPLQWQEENNAYLGKALHWLRLRLQRLIDMDAQAQTNPQPAKKTSGWFAGKKSKDPAPEALLSATDTAIRQLEAELASAEIVSKPPALVVLGQRLGLSRFEQNLLLLCAAMELDTRIANLCALAQKDSQQAYPCFALAFRLFALPDWNAMAATGPLRYWRLLEIHQPGAKPLTASALHIDERILNYLKGVNYLDDRLASYIAPIGFNAQALALPESQQAVVGAIAHYLQQGPNSPAQTIQLLGKDAISKQEVAQAAAQGLGLQLFQVLAESLPVQSAELEAVARLWQRESYLLPFGLYLDAQEEPEGSAKPMWQRFISRFNGLVFVGTREVQPGLTSNGLSFDVHKPLPTEQQQAWLDASSGLDRDGAGRLANQFDLNLSVLRQIANREHLSGQDSHSLFDHLWQGCLQNSRPCLDKLAQRIEPKASWQDLVVSDETRLLLRQLAGQVPNRHKVYDDWGFRQKMSRGLGISVLFAGDSGTGKTMAAEVIANDLKLNLYRIDLSAVVSKYIGETEKNLHRVFDAAEEGGALLFFDEADALFGKRSEVKDSHDRFANTQIADLLQRMEAYNGLAILATNMKNALDQAFLRRLRFIVNFTFPGSAERKFIWQKAFTGKEFEPNSEYGGLDFERLASFNLTGGNIHSIALNAAFLAAQDNSYVTMNYVMQAVRTEFRKLEKPINEAEFRVLEALADTA